MSAGEDVERSADPTVEVRQRLRARLADGPDAWLVGGAVRERLAGRAATDLDVAIAGSEQAAHLARGLARDVGGHVFPLSDAFGAWRVVAPASGSDGGPAWQVDVTPLQGEDLRADLARRDLTVNAIAEPVVGGSLIDPHGGRDDLVARRLRMVGPGAFAADPVRVLRLARFAAELGFAVDTATLAAALAAAPALRDAAGERLRPELERLVDADRWTIGWAVLRESGGGAALLPGTAADRDVVDPARAAALERLQAPGATVPEACVADREWLVARAPDRERRLARVLALLLLDHDDRAALTRLRPSRRLRAMVERTRMLAEGLRSSQADGADEPLTWWRTLRPLGEDGPDAVMVARQALGPDAGPWATLTAAAVRWTARPPTAPVRGDALAAALGIAPGPEIGRLLERLAIEADAGGLRSPEQVIERARALRRAARS